jgi:Spy/CpxP family protein refolding chaperone
MKASMTMAAFAVALQIAPANCIRAQDNGPKTGRHCEARWANLSADEREKMKAARAKAATDPSVKSAKQKLREARNEFRSSMRAAMLKADPSIEPILQKLPKAGD